MVKGIDAIVVVVCDNTMVGIFVIIDETVDGTVDDTIDDTIDELRVGGPVFVKLMQNPIIPPMISTRSKQCNISFSLYEKLILPAIF